VKRSRYTLAIYRPLCKCEISQARIRAFFHFSGSDQDATKKRFKNQEEENVRK